MLYELKDQLDRSLKLKRFPPERIVSLVPSLTETLYDLGLEDEVLGITRFCVHPQHWFHQKRRVGGTKDFKIERIDELKPDIVIANQEENTRSGVIELAKDWPVWVSRVEEVYEGWEVIRELGRLTSRIERAEKLIDQIQEGWTSMKKLDRPKTLYFIWKSPWMCAGSDTFISAVMEHLGMANVIREKRYPTIDPTKWPQDLEAPDLLLFSSEPFPFKEKHMRLWQERFPKAKALLVDGEAFSWYGSRMLHCLPYLRELLKSL